MLAYTVHAYQFPSSPWASALDQHKCLSAGVQSRLDRARNNAQTNPVIQPVS